MSEEDVFLALDLWERSQWELEDARALDRAPRVRADGAAEGTRIGEGSEERAVQANRRQILAEIW